MDGAAKKLAIFKNISWLTIAEVSFKIIGFVFFLVFTRRLGQTVLGFYTYIFAVLSLVNLFWDFGINSFYGRKWVTEDSSFRTEAEIVTSTRVFVIFITLLFLVPYVAIYQKTLWIEFSLAIAVYILDLFKAIPGVYFRSKSQFGTAFFIDLLDRGLGYGLAIAAMLMGYNLKAVLASLLISKIASAVYGNYLKQSFYFSFKIPYAESKKLLLQSAPFFMLSLFGTIYFRIDSIMIEHYINFAALGVYSAAYRLIDTSNIVTGIITSGVFPVLISLQGHKDALLPKLLTKNLKYLMAIAGFITVCGMFKSTEVIVFLFGETFRESGTVLKFLSPTILFLFINGLLLIQMLASHREKYVLKVLVFLAAFNILINLYFIPHYGIIGAAITTIICEALNCILLWQKLEVKLHFGWLPALMLSLAVASALLYFLPVFWMFSVAASAAAYFGLLYVSGFIDLTDLPKRGTAV